MAPSVQNNFRWQSFFASLKATETFGVCLSCVTQTAIELELVIFLFLLIGETLLSLKDSWTIYWLYLSTRLVETGEETIERLSWPLQSGSGNQSKSKNYRVDSRVEWSRYEFDPSDRSFFVRTSAFSTFCPPPSLHSSPRDKTEPPKEQFIVIAYSLIIPVILSEQ